MAMRSGRSILMSYAVQLVFAWKAIAMALKKLHIWKKGFLIFFTSHSSLLWPFASKAAPVCCDAA